MARLVKTQDGATAMKLWQECLSHVQDFLSHDCPFDYDGLSEHRDFCEVHRNLLTYQQNQTTDQFNILTNLHNETLEKIMERHSVVRDRLAAWHSSADSDSRVSIRFHRIMEELFTWLEIMHIISIRVSEPVDLTESMDIITAKYNLFRVLRNNLERCEPLVLSLQKMANQLLDERGKTTASLLRLRLLVLRHLIRIYTLILEVALGMDPRYAGSTTSSPASLLRDLLDLAASGIVQPRDAPGTDGDDGHPTVLSRRYRFLGQVLRISLPIQALMLVVLGLAFLVLFAEEDYSCML